MIRPALVYLADLTHTGVKVATESFPLNIGLLAAYAKKHLGDVVDIRLFKYPDKLFAALKSDPPEILGCSNYVWNSNLAEWACEFAKQQDPRILTVQGGTNYPFRAEQQAEFLKARPHTDIYVFYEGEVSFLHLLRRWLETHDRGAFLNAPVPGCQFIHPRTGELVSGPPVERIKNLDEIPSPYVTKVLDEFFDGRLTPMMETTRGCPFLCNFCNAGDVYFNKVNKFSLDYIAEELRYIAPRIAAVGITNLTLADNNFGMFARDVDVARLVHEVQQSYQWPLQMIAWTGKNSKERVIAATEVLGTSLSINMAVQSMDERVLINIKRDNIRLEAYKGINEVLTRQGRSQEAELIVPLPGETLASYMRGLEDLMAAKTKKLTSYTLQLLYGTDYKEKSYQRQHGYEPKWRVVPLDFGEYEGRKVFDVEQVAVSSDTLSFSDYLQIRSLALATELMYNTYIFYELVKFLEENGVEAFSLIEEALARLNEAPKEIQDIHASFLRETREELWDSEEALIVFYSRTDNYKRLVDGEAGGNVLFKHKALVITRHLDQWVDYIVGIAWDLVLRTRSHIVEPARLKEELHDLCTYIRCRLAGVLKHDGNTTDLVEELYYDVSGWVRDCSGRRLKDFRTPHTVAYRFYFDELQMAERSDVFQRYGTDVPGLFKILARTPTLHRLFRHVQPLHATPVGGGMMDGAVKESPVRHRRGE